MATVSSWRKRLARWVGGPVATRAARLYGGARQTRTTGGFGGSHTSADSELDASLDRLRSRSRQMVRDSAYAKRAKHVIVNNVIGAGVGLQAQVLGVRGAMNQAVNDAIEGAWREWMRPENCHTGGALHFHDLEAALFGEVFEAGEVIVRIHTRPFGNSTIPLGLELIEAERLVSNRVGISAINSGNEVRMGVEVDGFGRALAYWIRQRHDNDLRVRMDSLTDRVERVPADQIIHIKRTVRWPQTRGEPWLHAVVRKLDDLNEYSQLEVTAARGAAAYFATIETPDPADGLPDAQEADGSQVMELEALTIQSLNAGEKLSFHAPNRPNAALDAFVRAMLREISAGVGTSYEALSRDYSQTNYSSSRLALIDDRDHYRTLQRWWVRSFREPLHRIWLQQAVISRAIQSIPLDAYGVDRARYEASLFKCRGWSWVDPTKEVAAYKEAVRAGFTTTTDVIAATGNGMDIEDVIATRRRELDMFDAADIEVDTTVTDAPDPAPGDVTDPAALEDPAADGEDMAPRRAALSRIV